MREADQTAGISSKPAPAIVPPHAGAPDWTRGASAKTAFLRGLAVMFSTPGAVLFLTALGFGTLVRDAAAPPIGFVAWQGSALLVDAQFSNCGWAMSGIGPLDDPGPGTTLTRFASDGKVDVLQTGLPHRVVARQESVFLLTMANPAAERQEASI